MNMLRWTMEETVFGTSASRPGELDGTWRSSTISSGNLGVQKVLAKLTVEELM